MHAHGYISENSSLIKQKKYTSIKRFIRYKLFKFYKKKSAKINFPRQTSGVEPDPDALDPDFNFLVKKVQCGNIL